MYKFTAIVKYSVWPLAFLVLIYIAILNLTPFGITKYYVSGVNKEISEPGPKNRVSSINTNEGLVQKQTDDLIYFTTSMPFKFEKAKVKITFQNSSENQQLFLGFQDEDKWHYDNTLIDIPFLNLTDWTKVKGVPNIFQRQYKYQNIEGFLNNPPQSIIGSYYLDNSFAVSKMKIPNYQPGNTITEINTPIRGKQILYAYLENEPFKMWISKQDLNWYEEPDPVTIKVYKDKDVVYTATIDDDGIEDTSGKVLPVQEIYIQNPGPGLPEAGIYKIVLDGGADTIITNIKTNLHKIVFEGPIYLAGNQEVFPKINKSTNPNLLFTNAKIISARTYHKPSLQEIKIATEGANLKVASTSAKLIKLDSLNTQISTDSASLISQIFIPLSDIILSGQAGYFAFQKDQLFYPTAYSMKNIADKEDLENINYILTDYNPTSRVGNWSQAETEFDLSSAVIKNGKLSWLIKAPNLKKSSGEIIIKKIEVTLIKKPPNLPFKLPWIKY